MLFCLTWSDRTCTEYGSAQKRCRSKQSVAKGRKGQRWETKTHNVGLLLGCETDASTFVAFFGSTVKQKITKLERVESASYSMFRTSQKMPTTTQWSGWVFLGS